MVFTARKRTDDVDGMELLDTRYLQNMQDHFCEANHVYCVCLSKGQGVVTRAYGTRAELDYVHGKIGMSRHVLLVNKLLSTDLEDVVEEPVEENHLKMCAVAIKVGGKIAAIWIVIGVIEDGAIRGSDVPSQVKTTTVERFYKSIEFLELLSKQYFAVKLDELLAQEAFQKSRDSQDKMKEQLRRNEVMTGIVQMLESENSFSKIVEDILCEVCNYLDISNGMLLRLSRKMTVADVISEYTLNGEITYLERMQNIAMEELPFATGKPYMISSDSMLPDRFRGFFEKYGIQAMMSLPIEVNGTTGMYLCLLENRHAKEWDIEEIKFINEVKQIIQSILTKRIAKNSLASSYASLEAILENVGCGICVRDPETDKILYMNQSFRKLFLNHAIDGISHRVLSMENEENQNDHFLEYYSEEAGSWFDIYHAQIKWVDGRTVTLLTIYDVTDKKHYQQKIERQANNDFLTGLYNRMRCEQDVENYIRQTREHGGQGALLYIDLDDFKHINDGLGHQYGDVLLKSISHSLQRIPAIETTCYRMGGDEFVVIITHHQYNMMNEILEQIKDIFSKPWFLKGADYYCTMSMGVVRFPSDGDNVQELIKKVDIALYEAKKSGKNRIEFYDENVETTSFKRLDLEKNMRYATSDACSEFEVYYQPIVDITRPDDPCSGAEALIRWNSSQLGFISPTEFIPLAEYLGLINPIGSFVLREACKRCRYWNDMGHPDYHVNVNLSVVQLLQNNMVDNIKEALRDTKINPANLTLEVTESLAINDIGRMKRILAEIKQLGVLVALDDFGTGYSSLNHIRELPIDVIKIDRCFIIDIGKDDYSETFVKMVSELAETIGVKMCVEGVEESEQLEKLRKMKVQFIQGYYYGKPMKVEDFEKKYL